jgi:hypothetical protein
MPVILYATPQGSTGKRLKTRHYVFLVIVVATAVILAWSLSLLAVAAPPDGRSIRLLPASVGDLALAVESSGAQARVQVEQLHGKVLGAGLDQAWVGEYGDPPRATVWVTRSVRREDAEALLARMATRLGDGDSPFQLIGPVAVGGAHGYELEGMGQKHYYFLIGSDLYWLAIDPSLAVVGFGDLVRFGASVEEL